MRRTETRTVLVPASPRLDAMQALPAPYALRRVDGWDALRRELRAGPPSTVALVDPYAGEREDVLDERVRDLIREFPLSAVVAVLELYPSRVADLRTLLAWGVSEVVNFWTESLAGAVSVRLRDAHARPLKRRIEQVVPRTLSHEALTLLYAAAEVAVDGGGAPDLARLLGARARTVAGWCAREGLPPPRRLQAWVRLLLACALLEDPERSVVAAAWAAGYSNDNSLRRALRELAGGPLPRDRAFDAAAAAFAAELRERARSREAPPHDGTEGGG